jgi:hypothetical protein
LKDLETRSKPATTLSTPLFQDDGHVYAILGDAYVVHTSAPEAASRHANLLQRAHRYHRGWLSATDRVDCGLDHRI